MDQNNPTAYSTDYGASSAITFSNIPNPCSTPFVFKLGWVSPLSSQNTITNYAPEIPQCAKGGMLKYTSGFEPFAGQQRQWSLFSAMDFIENGGISTSPFIIGKQFHWFQEITLVSVWKTWFVTAHYIQTPLLSSYYANSQPLGEWQIPIYAGGVGVCPKFTMRQVMIENPSVQPDPDGGYTISGDIVCLPERTELTAELKWTLKITDTQNNVLFAKEGTGTRIEVAWNGQVVAWDGKASSQKVDPLPSLKYSILAVIPNYDTWLWWNGRFMGKTPTIEVRTDDPEKKLIATSDPEADQKTLLNQVFLPASQGNSVMVVVKDPPASGSSNYIVNINTTKSNPDPENPLPLPLAKDSQTHLYTGSLPLTSPWIVNHPQSPQKILTTFTSVDTTERTDSKAFINQMNSNSTILAYPSKRLQMGCAFKGANPLKPENFEEIELSLSAVQAAGFEEVIVSLPKPYTDVKARFRVKNETDVLYYSGHASYSWNSLTIYPVKVVDNHSVDNPSNPCPGPDPAAASNRPVNLTSKHWGGHLKTVIFACCAVLDINDYNGGAHKRYDEELHLQLQEYAPGLKWDELSSLSSGKRVLLGYNWYSPLGRTTIDTQVINKYFEYLTLGRRYSQPEAWIWANANLADLRPPENFPDNACAIDKDGYYFIKYDVVKKTGKHKNRILYKISRPWPGTWGEASKKAIFFGKMPPQEMINRRKGL